MLAIKMYPLTLDFLFSVFYLIRTFFNTYTASGVLNPFNQILCTRTLTFGRFNKLFHMREQSYGSGFPFESDFLIYFLNSISL